MNITKEEGSFVRLYHVGENGDWIDWQQDYTMDDFAGFLPNVGDMILEPGVLQGLDRHQPENRRMFTVVQRVFNPRDNSNYVALVVKEHVPTGHDRIMVTPR